MRGDEARVVAQFCTWLEQQDWKVQTEVDFCDVVATRGPDTLFAEAKGRTAAPGLDIDTMYGQVLRRMLDTHDPRARFGLVVPSSSTALVLRVPDHVRALLRLDVFLVADDGSVDLVRASPSV